MSDLIERQAVMNCYKKWQPYMASRLWEFEQELAKLPSVNPQEPKTGHWIEHEHNGILYIECSKCLSWFLRAHLPRNSYCPNCGAKMIEPQESDKDAEMQATEFLAEARACAESEG